MSLTGQIETSTFDNALVSEKALENVLETEKEEPEIYIPPNEIVIIPDNEITDTPLKSRKENLYNVVDKITNLKDVYSTALGTYCDWDTEVDLGPPKKRKKDVQVPDEDKYIFDYYNSLQYTLYETGYPETVDRTESPNDAGAKDGITVTILASPVECMAILLEGGRQSPENFLLVLSTTWMSKVPSVTHPDLYTLLVHKAIAFGRDGHTYMEVYDPPRKTTYFLNFFTSSITAGQRCDGEIIEEDLDCPMSSSVKLATMTDDKVWTRCIMADINMAFPDTLTFMYKSERLLESNSDKIKILHLDKNEGMDNLVKEEVKEFCERLASDGIPRIVVKPSGPAFHGSIGVTFHDTTDEASVTAAAISLLKQLDPGSSVLVETFIDALSESDPDKIKAWGANKDMGHRIRSTICRGPDGRPITTQIICGISKKSKPVNGDNTIPQSLESTLIAYGISDQDERDLVTEKINRQSEAMLLKIMKTEETLSTEEKGALHGQTDLIGIDFIIARIKGELTPVGIEVNSHDCTINCQIFEFMNAPMGYDQGKAVRPLIQTMILRSQLHSLVGKTVVLIGGGHFSKKDIYPSAKHYGLNVVLVDSDPNHFAKDQVYRFIYYDYTDHTRDYVHALNIADQLSNIDIQIDGCLTFWEDCGPLAADIVKVMGLTGNDVSAAFIAKKKSLTQETLRGRIDDIPHWPRTYLYASATQPITCEDDLELVKENFTFPVILKLEYGSSAVGVSLVHNAEDLMANYTETQSSLQSEEDFSGIGLGFGNNMAVMDYLQGSEHDVDIVIYKRKLLGAFVSDNGPTRIPFFTETAAIMPSTLPPDKVGQLVIAAYQCCTEIGLANGVFNVELKMTATGPKLIEINARMGGFYLRNWVKRIFGVDLMLCAMMISFGMKPFIPKQKPRTKIMGVMLVPSLHRQFLKESSTEHNLVKVLTQSGDIIWNQFDREAPEENSEHEEPMANIAVYDDDIETCREKLLSLCDTLKISSEDYDVEHFTKDF